MLWTCAMWTALIPALCHGVWAANALDAATDSQQFLRPTEAHEWADDVWTQLQGPASCQGCQSQLLALKSIALLGDRAFINAVVNLCKSAGTQDDDVCQGAIEAEGPILAEAVRHMVIGSKTAHLFCAGLLGLCEYPPVDEWDIPFPTRKPERGRPEPSGEKPLKVVHYSDVHVDLNYTEGANTHCSKPICCREYTEEDSIGNNDFPAGPNGDHQCDAPETLEASMYEAITELVPDMAFAIFTGDIVDHALWTTTFDSNEQSISQAYENMANSFDLVYGTAGNHEAHPTNAFQPNSVGDAARWIYNTLAEQWARWMTSKEVSDALRLGSYSAKYPNGNLRVISLNTNLFYRQNFWLYRRKMIRDPSGQLAWLIQELDHAEKAGENVYLIGHMSIGDRNAFHDDSNYLNQIIQRYSATIAGMFFGHTHRDEFQITYSDYDNRTAANALVMSYVSSSLTPTSGMPSFRVYDVDPVTFGVLDVTVYSADMRNQAFQTTGPVWKKYYSAKETYGALIDPPLEDPAAELTAAFWHNVTEAMYNSPAVFNAFMDRKSRGWLKSNCTDECMKEEICSLRAGRSQDNCHKPGPSVTLNSYADEVTSEPLECGFTIMGATLALLHQDRALLEQLATMYKASEAEARLEL